MKLYLISIRDLLRGYDSETINEIQEQLKGVIW